MLPTTTDVLVVGAGPTGLTAAVSLVARGREVTIVDDQDEGQHTAKASVVYSRTLELLEPYGVAQRLASQGIHARRFTIRDRDRVLMNVAFDRLPMPTRTRCWYPRPSPSPSCCAGSSSWAAGSCARTR